LLRPPASDSPLSSPLSSPLNSPTLPSSPPPPFEATQSPPRSRSLSSSPGNSPILAPRTKNPSPPKTHIVPSSKPRHSMPPVLAPRTSSGSRTASPARSSSSESSRSSGVGTYRQYQEDSQKMLSEAENMLLASKKSLEQRAQDLDQYRLTASPRSPRPEPGSLMQHKL